MTTLTNRRKKKRGGSSLRWCIRVCVSKCCPEGGCDVRMGPDDLYTRTSAQTVNNGTHTLTSHTHPLPCIHLAVTEPTRNFQWPNTCPHTHTNYILQEASCQHRLHYTHTATSLAAPEEVIHCSFTLNPTSSLSIYHVKEHKDTLNR